MKSFAPSLLCCSEKSWGKWLAWLGIFGFLIPSLAQGSRSWVALNHQEVSHSTGPGTVWTQEGDDGSSEMAWQIAEWLELGEESENAEESSGEQWWPQGDFDAIAIEAQLGVHSSVQFSLAQANRCACKALYPRPYLLYRALKIPCQQPLSC